MKSLLFALTLLLFVHATALPGNKTGDGAGYSTATATAFWPQDSTVNVYFVRDLFTFEQQQVLRQTLESWTTSQATSTVRFSYAGETGGLIDCLGCLTLTRQDLSANRRKRYVTFNRLRGNHTGQLISAWIGFETSITDSQKLKNLLVQVLGAEELLRVSTSMTTDIHETPERHR
ncbi:MAG TPA: hypothetical protein VIF64_15575 [Pyrinomonadaceae bacterium]